MDHLLPKVECPDFWIGDGCPFEIPRPDWALGGAWEGLFGDRVIAMLLLGPNPLKETNINKTTQEEKVFKDLPVSDAQKKHLGLPGNKEHALKTS